MFNRILATVNCTVATNKRNEHQKNTKKKLCERERERERDSDRMYALIQIYAHLNRIINHIKNDTLSVWNTMRWVLFILVKKNTIVFRNILFCVSLCVFLLFPLVNFWIGDKMNIMTRKHYIILWTQHVQCTTMCLNNIKCD